ncbi:Hypothetical predicted protein [Mytilus galloprovincialis]|uniref:Uncharacterized protein n=1 Tax=Mytilus galloprovincialis TaxID=29158 RepID=A0A8B6E9L6_MYTGA|nr:Hypothetical predicted protein [Mytilus galloprovincialis]
MDDVASSTSQAVHENAIPHITALKLSTHIQDQFSRASTSSTATKGNTSQDDESHLESTNGNGITSSDDFPLMTELSSKLSPNMTRRPKGEKEHSLECQKERSESCHFLKDDKRKKKKSPSLPKGGLCANESTKLLEPIGKLKKTNHRTNCPSKELIGEISGTATTAFTDLRILSGKIQDHVEQEQ